jgi:hypothetical protein
VRPQQLRRAAELCAAFVHDELLRIDVRSAVLSGAALDARGAGDSSSAGAHNNNSVNAAGLDSWRHDDDTAAADCHAGNSNDDYAASGGNAAEPDAWGWIVYGAASRDVYSVAEYNGARHDGAGSARFSTGYSTGYSTCAAAERQFWNGHKLSTRERSVYDADSGGETESEWNPKQQSDPSAGRTDAEA